MFPDLFLSIRTWEEAGRAGEGASPSPNTQEGTGRGAEDVTHPLGHRMSQEVLRKWAHPPAASLRTSGHPTHIPKLPTGVKEESNKEAGSVEG